MKKLLSVILTLALVCALAAPASAAAQADDRLSAVTLQVKQTLDLDTDGYDSFYGNLNDNPLSPTWDLEWDGPDGYLSIQATEEGKVLSYSRYPYESGESWTDSFSLGSFPALSLEDAQAAAQRFVAKVLAQGESVDWDAVTCNSVALNATRYRFRGEVLVNGLSAGLDFSVAVSCADGEVSSFYRNDLTGQVMGDVPGAAAEVTQAQAAAALRETLALRLEYVLPEGDDSRAVLRYLPESGDEFYVDAATGERVNLSELYRSAAETVDFNGALSGGSDSAAEEDAGALLSPSLSGAEQEGVAKLEGVLDRDELDARARAWSALGLDSYTLATVRYTVGETDEDGVTPVTAALVYGRQVGAASWRRTVTLDARSGELETVYSSASLPEDGPERTVDAAAAQRAAEDFLAALVPAQFAKTALYHSADALESDRSVSHSFTYAQRENGYFYTGNAFYVGVDATDGSISSLSGDFDDAVTFDSPDGILTPDQAIDAWLDTYDVRLQYVLVPAAIDFTQPEYEPLEGLGVAYLYRLVLGYQLERFDYVYGIDAKTGEAVTPAVAPDDSLSYDDLEGHWVRAEAERLAQYGVGFAGGSFRPDDALTQRDLLALLLSTEGYLYQPEEEGAADRLYERAYSEGLLKKEERDDDARMTRAQTVKLLLDAAGYGPVAQLEGIYRTGFTDDAAIGAADYGYAALAQGLGVVAGSQFLPGVAATRAVAATMLYRLLNR